MSSQSPHSPAIWRNHWIRPYESLWSVLQNYATRNYLSTRELSEFLLQPEKRTQGYRKFTKKILLLGNKVLQQNLISYLEFDEKQYTESIVPYYIFDMHSEADLSMFCSASLKFCPQCMKEKFHTQMFQLHWVTKCPYHNIELFSQCPHCFSKTPYEISDNHFGIYESCPNCYKSWISSKNINLRNIALSENEIEVEIDQYIKTINRIDTDNRFKFINISLHNQSRLCCESYYGLFGRGLLSLSNASCQRTSSYSLSTFRTTKLFTRRHYLKKLSDIPTVTELFTASDHITLGRAINKNVKTMIRILWNNIFGGRYSNRNWVDVIRKTTQYSTNENLFRQWYSIWFSNDLSYMLDNIAYDSGFLPQFEYYFGYLKRYISVICLQDTYKNSYQEWLSSLIWLYTHVINHELYYSASLLVRINSSKKLNYRSNLQSFISSNWPYHFLSIEPSQKQLSLHIWTHEITPPIPATQ